MLTNLSHQNFGKKSIDENDALLFTETWGDVYTDFHVYVTLNSIEQNINVLAKERRCGGGWGGVGWGGVGWGVY